MNIFTEILSTDGVENDVIAIGFSIMTCHSKVIIKNVGTHRSV